jgi:MFS family permease
MLQAQRRSWLGFSAMCFGLFMALLDIQIVAAALPRIATSLNMPLDVLSWVQTAYLVSEVIAIAVSGVLARAVSTRWLFAAAAVGFVCTVSAAERWCRRCSPRATRCSRKRCMRARS